MNENQSPSKIFLVREARLSDLDDIYEIEVECFSSEAYNKGIIGYFLKTPEFIVLVAEVKKQILGFVIGGIEHHGTRVVGHVYTLDVRKRYRRKGIGYKLMHELERCFLKKKASICYLEVKIDNLQALKLYEKMGYKRVRTLSNYYGRGAHAYLLMKKLKTN